MVRQRGHKGVDCVPIERCLIEKYNPVISQKKCYTKKKKKANLVFKNAWLLDSDNSLLLFDTCYQNL
jgi:hypothetical protein